MSAQEGVYYTIDESDGLPSTYVYRVFEDSKGYIWIATEEGAARYDGHTMKVYNASNGLANNDVYKIFEDECDRIWFITMSSDLNFIKDDSLHTVRTGSRYRMNDFWADSLTTKFTVDSDVDSKLLTVPCNYPKSELLLRDVGGEYGSMSINETRGLNLGFRPSDNARFVTYTDGHDNVLQEFSTGFLKSTVNHHGDGLGLFNLYSQKGLFVLDIKRDTCFIVMLEEGEYSWQDQYVIHKNERSNSFEIVVKDSIRIYNQDFEEIDRLKLPDLSSATVSSYYLDSKNNLWVSTDDGIRIYLQSSLHYSVSKYVADKAGPKFSKVTQRGNHLLLVSENAYVFSFDILTNELKEITRGPNRKNSVYDTELVDDTLFVSSQIMGLAYMAISGDKLVPYSDDEFVPICNDIRFRNGIKYFKTTEDLIVVTSRSQLLIIDRNSKEFAQLSTNDILCVNTNDFDIWTAEPSEVHIYSRTSFCEFDRTKIDFAGCNFIYFVGDHALLANEQGYLIDCKSFVCDTIGKVDGGGIVKAVKADNLLFSTKSYMYSLVLDSTTVVIKELLDYRHLGPGVLVRDFVLVDGVFYFATNKGLMSTKYKAPLQVDQSIDLYLDSHRKDEYYYPYDHETIKLEFSSSYMSGLAPIIYEYQLEGLTEQYEEVKGRSVTFPKLSHGSYVFKLRARSENGEVLDSVSVNLTVKPPWWNTLWFYLLLGTLLVISFLLLFRYALSRLQQQAAVDQQFAELELNALQSQMSPHFMFNTMNSLQNLVASGQTEEADKYISKFASVLRKYLEISRSKFIPLEVEMEVTKLYLELEALRFDGRFRFYIDNKLSSREYSHLVPATLIQPFAENALVHGLFHKKGSGNILIKLFSVEDLIHVEIIDNGVGRAKADQRKKQRSVVHESRGQEIIKDRLALIEKLDNFQITYSITDLYEGEVSLGTKVSIVIRTNAKYEGSYS